MLFSDPWDFCVPLFEDSGNGKVLHRLSPRNFYCLASGSVQKVPGFPRSVRSRNPVSLSFVNSISAIPYFQHFLSSFRVASLRCTLIAGKRHQFGCAENRRGSTHTS